MSASFSFRPDLILEATSVCDRACQGCYAPNVISAHSPKDFYEKNPELFLNPKTARVTLESLSVRPLLVSIRGGEPTKHPKIAEIVQICTEFSKQVVLETHGRWLLSDDLRRDLLPVLTATGSVVKISFDRMHGLKPNQLRLMTDTLVADDVQFFVAITETSDVDLLAARNLCPWVPDSQIIYQKMAMIASELIEPSLGVVGVNGKHKRILHTKKDFRENSSERIAI